MPKQFLDFFGTGKTMLQETYERFRRFLPAENIYVSTYKEYQDIVAEQLPHLDRDNLLIEPIRRNTAPIVAWAAHRIEKNDSEASIIISPADQIVMNEEAFQKDTLEAMAHAKADRCFLTMGIRPTRPEPGYGYIQMGDVVENANGEEGFYKVQSFTEKPEREFAEMFMNSGEFYWNTGLFIARCSTMRNSLKALFPPVLSVIDSASVYSLEAEQAHIAKRYSAYPNLSVDSAVLEKGTNVYVKNASFGWADLGTWHSMYETMSKCMGDNVVIGNKVKLDNCHGNIVKMPDDHVAVLNGLDGYIVAEKGNVLLVCKKEDSSALVRKYINEVRMDHGEEYL